MNQINMENSQKIKAGLIILLNGNLIKPGGGVSIKKLAPLSEIIHLAVVIL